MPLSLKELQASDNLTEVLDEDGQSYLAKMGYSVVKGYEIDMASRKEWEETISEALDIAKQVMTEKNFPWPNSANIKYPLVCEAAIDFSSRIMPEVLPNDKIVKMAIQGSDPNSHNFMRGERISSCMSYQCMSSPDWIHGLDSSLQMLPVIGTIFKKTYWSETEKRIISEVCSPKDIVVNYNTKSLKTARRITHKIKLSINDIIERQRRGLYNDDVDVESLRPLDCPADDDDFEIDLLEQHCWWDLDEDDYKEPYIVTVHEPTNKVLRIVSNIDTIERNKDKEVIKITANQYFTDYHFIPSPDGGYYSMGFGSLLLPINKTINTILNQLLDAGTVAVTQGGLLGKGLRLRDGEYRFKPYEWKVCDAAPGTALKDNVFPFPVREPSQVLFSLLELMIKMGKDLTNSTEALNGDMTGSNVSDKTMNTMVEQGSKIFVAIYKRFLWSLGEEYRKMYHLNRTHLTDKEYAKIIQNPHASVKEDFEEDDDSVRPVADPVFSSLQQRITKITALMNLKTASPRAVDEYILQSLQFEDDEIKKFLPPIPQNQPPPPKDQRDLAAAAQAQANAQLAKLQAMQIAQEAPVKQALTQKQMELIDSQIGESAARSSKMGADITHNQQKVVLAGAKLQSADNMKAAQQVHSQHMDVADVALQNKDLNIKASSDATKAILEAKKIAVMAAKTKPEGGTA